MDRKSYLNNKFSSCKIIQWNARSINNKYPEFCRNIEPYDIVMLSETWLWPEDNFSVRGFDVVRTDRMDQMGGGVAILIRKDIKYIILQDLIDANQEIELCGLEIEVAGKPLSVLSCYRPPENNNIDSDTWDRIFNQIRGRALFCGDFNAHHTAWGDKRVCEVGRGLLNSLDNTELVFLNDGHQTYFNTYYNSSSVVDLSLIHSSLIWNTTWEVGSDSWGSDHFHRARTRLYSHNIDWELFRNKVDNSLLECGQDLLLINDYYCSLLFFYGVDWRCTFWWSVHTQEIQSICHRFQTFSTFQCLVGRGM